MKAAYPFQKTSYLISAKAGNFFELLTSISDFKKENERLTKENNELASQIADLKDQKKENEILRKQLELLPRSKYELEGAFIIGRDPRGTESWILIDKGKSSGIKEGMPVIVSEGILVGKIEEVFSDSSKIILLTDSASFVNAVDLETGAKGILSGEYSLGIILGMVEQSDVLNIGDQVITSGLGGSLPKGFLIGRIQQIYNTQDKLFQQAVVIPKIEYSDLDIVFVVKGTI